MTDGTGQRLWEHLFPFIEDHRVEMIPEMLCPGIVTTKNELVIVAAGVLVFPSGQSDEQARRSVGSHLVVATLLEELDMQGNPIRWVRHDNASGGLLVGAADGTLRLFETPAVDYTLNTRDQGDHRLRLYSLDSDLKNIKPPTALGDSTLDRVEAAFATPEGGVLFKGCPGHGDTTGYLRYVAPDGTESTKRHIAELGSVCGNYYRFAGGARPGEALLLVQIARESSRLITVKYSN
jgi:hypothetical protein